MRLGARLGFCLGLTLLPATAGAQAKDATAESTAALRARITALPSRPVDLKKVEGASPWIGAGRDAKAAPPAKSPAPVKAPSPVAPEAPAATARASYIPLPPAEHAATNEVLTRQLQVKAPRADLPAIVPFRGALVTQSVDAGEVTLIPTVVVDDPLRFDPATRQFLGSIAVGLVELGVKGPSKRLPAAVMFQTIGAVTADPEEAEVKSTAPPFRKVAIAARDPSDKVELRVFSTGMEPVLVAVPVERARLQLAGKRRLQGWGLESTDIAVSASNGAASKGQEVVLRPPELGTLSPMTLRLKDNGTGAAKLRSEGTGTVVLMASSPALGAPEPLSIEFESPTRFLLSGLVGGLVGAVLKKGGRRAGIKRWMRDLLLGVLTGAVVLGLFVFGVNVTGFPLPPTGGEVLVFVVAAIGAFVGTQLLQPR